MTVKQGQVLWKPTDQIKKNATLTQFMNWLKNNNEVEGPFNTYHDVWQWSVDEPAKYWESVWRYFDVIHSSTYENVMIENSMIDTKWFTGARLNYTENVFKQIKNNKVAIYSKSELRPLSKLTWGQLKSKVTAVSNHLRSLGVQSGDRVVAYMPNIPETVVAFLAVVSIGAVWSTCPPEFGVSSTLSRFKQINPKVIFTVDGYQYNGKNYDKINDIEQIIENVPSIKHTVVIPYVHKKPDISLFPQPVIWKEVLQTKGQLVYEQVPFEHPLWILYSSGTTGLPKAIVHSQGGMLLSSLSGQILQANLKPDDRYFWFTTTGWMLWNTVVGTLNSGASIVLYDGSPTYPRDTILWELVEETRLTHFGTSPHFILSNMKKNIKPKDYFDLSSLRSFAYTGAPLPPEGFKWVYDQVKEDVRLIASAGGTDICGPIVSSSALLPVYAGEMPARALGVSAYSYNVKGEVVFDEVGEMVITKPLPSMPLYFWGDEDFLRYKESYYDTYPNVWRHGDLLKITNRKTAIIYGRSDATINRGGVRSGSSEIYRVIEKQEEIINSLVIDLSRYQRKSELLLFVVLREGLALTESMRQQINQSIRDEVSPRHVPDRIISAPAIPMTMTGKKMEIPVREILLGKEVKEVVNVDLMSNPEAISYFEQLSEEFKN